MTTKFKGAYGSRALFKGAYIDAPLLGLILLVAVAGCSGDKSDGIDSGTTDTDTGEPVSTPIVVINDADVTKYFFFGITMGEAFFGSKALTCEYSEQFFEEAWLPCLLDRPYCEPYCADVPAGSECYGECEPSDIIKQLLPGESLELPWQAVLWRENTEHCFGGGCYEPFAAPVGVYRFSLAVHEEILCNPEPCVPDEDGFYVDETLPDPPITFSVEVTLPLEAYSIEIHLMN